MSNSIGSYSVPQPAVEAELVMRHHNGDVTKVEFPGGVSASIDYGVDYQDVGSYSFGSTHRLKTSEQYTMTLNIMKDWDGTGNVMVFHKGGKWMNKKALRKIAKKYLESQVREIQEGLDPAGFDVVKELENLGYNSSPYSASESREHLKECQRFDKALQYVGDLIENAAVTVTVTETKKEEKRRLKREAKKKESTADLVSEW